MIFVSSNNITPSSIICKINKYLYARRQSPKTMAISVSSSSAALFRIANPKPNPPRIVLSFKPKGPNCVKCNLTSGHVKSWTAAANYVKLQMGYGKVAQRTMVVSHLTQKSVGTVKCATIEDIEAEKSLIEKNVVSLSAKKKEWKRLLKMFEQISALLGLDDQIQQCLIKVSLKAIEKAIVNSDLGMTPSNDGDVIRLSIPQLTADRRKELSKMVAKQAEEGKVALRNIRRDAIKSYDKLEKEKKLSEDIVKDLSSDLQKVTDEYIKKVDSIFKQKEKELMTV